MCRSHARVGSVISTSAELAAAPKPVSNAATLSNAPKPTQPELPHDPETLTTDLASLEDQAVAERNPRAVAMFDDRSVIAFSTNR